MTFAIPLQVHVIWHPKDDSHCRPIVERLRTALTRDSYQPLVPGIGIPVFYRCAGAIPGEVNGVPRSIQMPDTLNDLRIALVTAELEDDPGWHRYLAESIAETKAKSPHAATIRVALSAAVAGGADLAEVIDPKSPQAADQVLQLTILQACRLLSGRPRDNAGHRRSAAPMKLFLSHTKRDPAGLKIASALKRHLDGLRVDRFFDEVSIQPGDELGDTLKAEIDDAAVVAIRTDQYVSSPWCRMELDLAKRARRPMVVVDALSTREQRSSPLLTNLPSVRLAETETQSAERLAWVTTSIGLEVLRFVYAGQQLELLKQGGLVASEAILLTRPPEMRDLFAVRDAGGQPAKVLYPDPVLTAEESADLEKIPATFRTPTSLWGQRLTGKRIGLSIGEPDPAELIALGLSKPHIDDASRIIARMVLAADGTVVYGGTLHDKSLTECMFEMIAAYQRVGAPLQPLRNITPWPWWHDVDAEWRVARRGYLEVVKSPPPKDPETGTTGNVLGGWKELIKTTAGRCDLIRSLTGMRRELAANTDARVVLGGRSHSFVGLYPGILEEALVATEHNQPLYVLGGFAGAAHNVAQALMGKQPVEFDIAFQRAKSPEYAAAMDAYAQLRAQRPDLNLPAVAYGAATQTLAAYGDTADGAPSALSRANGLSDDENRMLFATASLDEALYLIMKGLDQAFGSEPS
jgi:hypothetical protein